MPRAIDIYKRHERFENILRQKMEENQQYTNHLVYRLDAVDTTPMGWIWPGWIPAGMLTILGGHVGEGKSTVVASLIAALSRGATLPDGTTMPPINILVISTEDDHGRVVRPRLEANGVDPKRVYILETSLGLEYGRRTWPDNDREAVFLENLVLSEDIKLIVLDPLSGLLRRLDRSSEGEVREALLPLMNTIHQTGVAVLGLLRIGKAGSVRRPAQSLIGSSAVPAIARSVLMIASDRSSDAAPGTRVIEVVKSNYANPPRPLSLTMDAAGVVHWNGPAASSIDELASMGDDPRLTRSERAEAASFLADTLAGGPERATVVLEAARKAGFSEITVRRAKKDVGVKSIRDPQFRGVWRWCLPGHEDKAPDPAQGDHDDPGS